jgi:hypothetical protein
MVLCTLLDKIYIASVLLPLHNQPSKCETPLLDEYFILTMDVRGESKKKWKKWRLLLGLIIKAEN